MTTNELPENFGGDCMLLQRRLRRFIELKGNKVEELPDGRIRCEVDDKIYLTLYSKPQFINGSPSMYFGDIYYSTHLTFRREYINEVCAQALYEELNIAIKEMEHNV